MRLENKRKRYDIDAYLVDSQEGDEYVVQAVFNNICLLWWYQEMGDLLMLADDIVPIGK